MSERAPLIIDRGGRIWQYLDDLYRKNERRKWECRCISIVLILLFLLGLASLIWLAVLAPMLKEKDMILMGNVSDLAGKDMLLMAKDTEHDNAIDSLQSEIMVLQDTDVALQMDITGLQQKDMVLMNQTMQLDTKTMDLMMKDMMVMDDIMMLQNKDMILMADLLALTNITTTILANGTAVDVKLMQLMMDAMALETIVEMNTNMTNLNMAKITQNMMDIMALESYAKDFQTDSGTASSMGTPGVLNIEGGKAISTTGTGNTVTIDSTFSVSTPGGIISPSPTGLMFMLEENTFTAPPGVGTGVNIRSDGATQMRFGLDYPDVIGQLTNPTNLPTLAPAICAAPTCASPPTPAIQSLTADSGGAATTSNVNLVGRLGINTVRSGSNVNFDVSLFSPTGTINIVNPPTGDGTVALNVNVPTLAPSICPLCAPTPAPTSPVYGSQASFGAFISQNNGNTNGATTTPWCHGSVPLSGLPSITPGTPWMLEFDYTYTVTGSMDNNEFHKITVGLSDTATFIGSGLCTGFPVGDCMESHTLHGSTLITGAATDAEQTVQKRVSCILNAGTGSGLHIFARRDVETNDWVSSTFSVQHANWIIF